MYEVTPKYKLYEGKLYLRNNASTKKFAKLGYKAYYSTLINNSQHINCRL